MTADDRLRMRVLARMWHDPGGDMLASEDEPSDP
jgi:hypothetical protein